MMGLFWRSKCQLRFLAQDRHGDQLENRTVTGPVGKEETLTGHKTAL
jgi:hypothetical protein